MSEQTEPVQVTQAEREELFRIVPTLNQQRQLVICVNRILAAHRIAAQPPASPVATVETAQREALQKIFNYCSGEGAASTEEIRKLAFSTLAAQPAGKNCTCSLPYYGPPEKDCPVHGATQPAGTPDKGEGEHWECPECGYKDMPWPPKDYHVCPKCMVEFGNDDKRTNAAERERASFERGRREGIEQAAQVKYEKSITRGVYDPSGNNQNRSASVELVSLDVNAQKAIRSLAPTALTQQQPSGEQ